MALLFQLITAPDSSSAPAPTAKQALSITTDDLRKAILAGQPMVLTREQMRASRVISMADELGFKVSQSVDLDNPGRVRLTFTRREALKGLPPESSRPRPMAIPGPLDTTEPPADSLLQGLRQSEIKELPPVAPQRTVPGRRSSKAGYQPLPVSSFNSFPEPGLAQQAWTHVLRGQWWYAADNLAGIRSRHSSPGGVLDECVAVCKWNAALEQALLKYNAKRASGEPFNSADASRELAPIYLLLQQAEQHYLQAVKAKAPAADIARRQLALAELYADMKWVLQYVTPKSGRMGSYETELAALYAEAGNWSSNPVYLSSRAVYARGPRQAMTERMDKLMVEMEERNTKLVSDIEAKQKAAMAGYAKALLKGRMRK